MKVYALKFKDKYVHTIHNEFKELYLHLTECVELAEVHSFNNFYPINDWKDVFLADTGERINSNDLKFVEIDIIAKEIK